MFISGFRRQSQFLKSRRTRPHVRLAFSPAATYYKPLRFPSVFEADKWTLFGKQNWQQEAAGQCLDTSKGSSLLASIFFGEKSFSTTLTNNKKIFWTISHFSKSLLQQPIRNINIFVPCSSNARGASARGNECEDFASWAGISMSHKIFPYALMSYFTKSSWEIFCWPQLTK
jgi:hypothetical protein